MVKGELPTGSFAVNPSVRKRQPLCAVTLNSTILVKTGETLSNGGCGGGEGGGGDGGGNGGDGGGRGGGGLDGSATRQHVNVHVSFQPPAGGLGQG